MKVGKTSKMKRIWVGSIGFLMIAVSLIGNFSLIMSPNVVAEPQNTSTQEETAPDNNESEEENNEPEEENNPESEEESSTNETNQVVSAAGDGCKASLGALSWFICPLIEITAKGVDKVYGMIEGWLQLDPVSFRSDSAIQRVWEYVRIMTNAVFIMFFLVVIYSQITGVGISNYGIKKVLPKIVVVAVLINLSFLICSLAIDVSNVIGNGLRGLFSSIEESVLNSTEVAVNNGASMEDAYKAIVLGSTLAVGGGAIVIESGLIWMLIPTALGAFAAVGTGLITIALRQAVVALLVMISPLAFVAYMLPNTEIWFKRWKDVFMQMLVFFPAFSLLYGASSLASFAIMMTAIANKDGFWLILALGVQTLPLFYSVKLMQMSNTFLGSINAKLQGLAATPLATNRAWADSHRQLTRQKTLASGITPSARLVQFLSNRKVAREEETNELASYVKLRGQAYGVRRNYNTNGVPTAEGEAAYKRQALSMMYTLDIERHKNNMNKGLGSLEAVEANAGAIKKARLKALDVENVVASDKLKMEASRGEKIDYENAKGFHKRMEDAINVHFDDVNGRKKDYKMHEIKDRDFARGQYNAIVETMEGDVQGIHYAAAMAAQNYDTQKKIVETKMQKYFELTPPTKDVEFRLSELTKDKDAIDNVDSIISGLRVLNQRGDTDLVKKHMDELLAHKVQLGTHASQALAGFLMFDVKDSDPWLRRFGKYINLETANVYNKNRRKVMEVDYGEYVKGYHDGEPDSEDTPGGRMYAKKGMVQLTEGTSLDNIERTALANLDESLKKVYGFDKDHEDQPWDVSGWMKKRKEVQKAMEPAFFSAALKWPSGSEQISSAVKFWTGYGLEQVGMDENNEPIFKMKGVWENEKGLFTGYEKGSNHEKKNFNNEVKAFFRDRVEDFFRDQTTGQILGMRSDFKNAMIEHMLEDYFLEGSLNREKGDGETEDERRMKYEEARAEIQTRYGDESPEVAVEKRKNDMAKLKEEYAGKKIREVLGLAGKLGQMWDTKKSGTAINAKDWLRSITLLDDKEKMFDEVKFYERLRSRESSSFGSNQDDDGYYRIYNAETRMNIKNSFDKLWDDHKNESADVFYGNVESWLKDWFGGGDTEIGKKFSKYYESKKENNFFSASELMAKMKEILDDPENFPDS